VPFVISSAPGICQEVISSILAGIERNFIYLDDILLWGKIQEECLQTLHQVLAKLEEYHVTLNVKKSQFLVRSVIYLGFLLDGQGSRPDPRRMDELLKKPRPASHSQLKSFIGMITFFTNMARIWLQFCNHCTVCKRARIGIGTLRNNKLMTRLYD
jgi:hypothetical protein